MGLRSAVNTVFHWIFPLVERKKEEGGKRRKRKGMITAPSLLSLIKGKMCCRRSGWRREGKEGRKRKVRQHRRANRRRKEARFSGRGLNFSKEKERKGEGKKDAYLPAPLVNPVFPSCFGGRKKKGGRGIVFA